MRDKVINITKNILKYIGGKENISSFEHCITRLRINIINIDQVDFEKLNKIEGVMAVIRLENQIQIVVGPSISGKIGDRIEEELSIKNDEIKISKIIINLLRDIGYIFVPILPAIVGCGLILGILNITYNFNLSQNFDIIKYIDLLSNSIYLYMPIFVGISGAKYYGLSYVIGGVLGSLGLVLNFDLSILALIFTIKLLAILEKKLRNMITEYLEMLLNPLIILLLGLLLLSTFNFIGIFILDVIEAIILYFMNLNKIITGFVMAASFLPFISMGLHHSLLPLNIYIMGRGLNYIWPILVMAGAGQVGVSTCIYLNTYDIEKKLSIREGLIFGVLGIGELLIYRVTKEKKDRFIISCIAAGIGGAIISYYQVSSKALVLGGWPLLLAIEFSKIKYYILGLVISFISGYFLMTLKLYLNKR